MRTKRSIVVLSIALIILLAFNCKSPKSPESSYSPSKQERAEDAVKSWMLKGKEYPHYKPVVFGHLTPRYQKTNRVFQITVQISEEEELSKTIDNKSKLDSLKVELEKNKGDLLGYLLPHKFQELNMAGEIITKELLFFLDTSLRVASALTPESFDYIMDEKVFFRLDSANN